MTTTIHAPVGLDTAGSMSVLTRLRRFARAMNTAVILSQEARARRVVRDRLLSMSDANLAELGLTRDGITRHVYPELFRD